MQFEQLTPGVVVTTTPRLVRSAEIIEFSTRYDPQWFQLNLARARLGRWKGQIASGWLTCSIAMELTVRHILHESKAFGSPGVDAIEWLEPVRPDDALCLRFEVICANKSPSGRTGIVLATTELWNQKERQVFSMQVTYLFDIASRAFA